MMLKPSRRCRRAEAGSCLTLAFFTGNVAAMNLTVGFGAAQRNLKAARRHGCLEQGRCATRDLRDELFVMTIGTALTLGWTIAHPVQ
jgi:hypothetical protein